MSQVWINIINLFTSSDDGENLMCPNNTKMTDASRIAALDLHNHYRYHLSVMEMTCFVLGPVWQEG